MPWPFSRSAVLTELATAPLIRCLILASSSMKKFAVEPEPTPTIASSTTYLIASRATACFSSSWVMRLFLPWRRQIGAHALERFGRQTHRFGERRMWMNGAADVDRVCTHLDRERDLADQVACMGADDAPADDPVRRVVEQELREAFVAAVGDGASRRRPGKQCLAQLDAFRLGLVLGDARPRDFRVGVGDRRNHARVEEGFLAGGRFGGDVALVCRLVREH